MEQALKKALNVLMAQGSTNLQRRLKIIKEIEDLQKLLSEEERDANNIIDAIEGIKEALPSL